MPQVCRTCLEEILDANCIRLSNTSFKIKEELHACIPEVDVELVPNAVMCTYCLTELHNAYDFKQKCLFTEKQIRGQLHSQAAIDLSELKKANVVEVLNGNGVAMDVVYISAALLPAVNEKTVVAGINGTVDNAQDVINTDEDDDDDDLNSSNLLLGLCESAPRKRPPPVSSTSKPESSSKSIGNSINPSPPIPKVIYSAKKSTTKSATRSTQSIVLPSNTEISISPVNRLSCHKCNATLSNINMYVAHIRNTHKGENVLYKCPKCSFEITNHTTFLQHYEKHQIAPNTSQNNAYKCRQCNYVCADTRALNRHRDTHTYKCNKCMYIAIDLTGLQKHLSTHTFTLESDEVVVIDDDEDIACDHCNFISKGILQYENHCLSAHGIRFPHVCKECGYTAGSKPSLNKHSKFHTGQRMYKCHICTYNCDLLYNLKKHLGTRHAAK